VAQRSYLSPAPALRSVTPNVLPAPLPLPEPCGDLVAAADLSFGSLGLAGEPRVVFLSTTPPAGIIIGMPRGTAPLGTPAGSFFLGAAASLDGSDSLEEVVLVLELELELEDSRLLGSGSAFSLAPGYGLRIHPSVNPSVNRCARTSSNRKVSRIRTRLRAGFPEAARRSVPMRGRDAVG